MTLPPGEPGCLTSADELRPPAPSEPTQAEIDEVIAAQAAPTEEVTAAIERWGEGPAILPWSKLAVELIIEFDIGGFPQSRFMAIYHTALHDAVIAAWDAQVAYGRPSPAASSDLVTPAAGVDPSQPSFPSEHAAVAGAAATVLTYLLPDAEAGRFDALAQEAAESRVAAGAAFRSDVEAGLALGQAVGEKAVTRAQGDGSDAQWDPADQPTGPGYWQPTPPGMVETPAGAAGRDLANMGDDQQRSVSTGASARVRLAGLAGRTGNRARDCRQSQFRAGAGRGLVGFEQPLGAAQ